MMNQRYSCSVAISPKIVVSATHGSFKSNVFLYHKIKQNTHL